MPAMAAPADKRPEERPGPAAQKAGAGTAEPVIVHVRDARSGDMEVFAGTRQARLRDPAVAARLSHAVTRTGGE